MNEFLVRPQGYLQEAYNSLMDEFRVYIEENLDLQKLLHSVLGDSDQLDNDESMLRMLEEIARAFLCSDYQFINDDELEDSDQIVQVSLSVPELANNFHDSWGDIGEFLTPQKTLLEYLRFELASIKSRY